MLAAENWCVKVDNKIYGPYTSEQMRKYAHEGRLAAWSLIAPAGSRAWCEAKRESTFANFFGYATNDDNKQSKGPVFGKKTDQAPSTTAEEKEAAEIGAANFVIIFDVVSASASRVEAAIVGLGNAFRIADNVWSLTCELTAVGVRNAIAPYLLPSESIFVIDASRGRTSWQNYAPESHAKISATYLKNRTS